MVYYILLDYPHRFLFYEFLAHFTAAALIVELMFG